MQHCSKISTSLIIGNPNPSQVIIQSETCLNTNSNCCGTSFILLLNVITSYNTPPSPSLTWDSRRFSFIKLCISFASFEFATREQIVPRHLEAIFYQFIISAISISILYCLCPDLVDFDSSNCTDISMAPSCQWYEFYTRLLHFKHN